MTNIDKVGSAGFDPSVTFTDPLSRLANRTLEDVPPAADGKTVPPSDLPTLEAPAHALSIERLVAAIGNEMRRQGVREGLDAIDSQAQEIDQKYSEKLAEIAKEIDKKENQSIWDKICKVFRCIGMALGFIASIATIAAGSAMGNPALIVAGVAALLLTIDSVVSEATGGKVSLSAGFTELGKVFGLSDNTAKWFGFGMNMALTVAAVAISFGGAAASSAASAVSQLRHRTDQGAQGRHRSHPRAHARRHGNLRRVRRARTRGCQRPYGKGDGNFAKLRPNDRRRSDERTCHGVRRRPT